MDELANSDGQWLPAKTISLRRRAKLVLLIGLCSVGFFIADVLTPLCFDEAFSAMLALGVVTAQLTVICVWGTLVRGTFWIRLPWTLLLLVLSWCGFAWGISIEKVGPGTASMLGVALLWMFGFVTSFVPLKIAALCFGWQIVHDSEQEQDAERKFNYAIRDILIGTLLLALTMGIGRAMIPAEDISFSQALQASGLDAPEPLFAITLYGIVSLLVKLPCIWISLGEQVEKIPARIGVWFVYCFLLAIGEIALLIAFLGGPGGDANELFGGMIISHQIMGAIMLAVCFALRGLGYRLERSRVRQAEQQAERVVEAQIVIPQSDR